MKLFPNQSTIRENSRGLFFCAFQAGRMPTKRSRRLPSRASRRPLKRRKTSARSGVNVGSGKVRVKHKEYLGDIYSASTFTNVSLKINPGEETTFPWLSQMAKSFEEYKMNKLSFIYKSMSSDAVLSSAASSALGTIIMATDYDASDDLFTTKFEMENNYKTVSGKPSISFKHRVECKQNVMKKLFVRTENNITADPRFTDIGNFQIAVQGCQATGGVIGELWVEYDCSLSKPQFINGMQVATAHFQTSYAAAAAAVATPFGTVTATGTTGRLATGGYPVEGSTLDAIISYDGTYNYLVFDPDMQSGEFLFIMKWKSSAGVGAFTPPTLLFSNCSAQTVWQADTQSSDGTTATNSTANPIMLYVIRITAPNASVRIGTNAVIAAGAGTLVGDVWITELPQSIAT